MALQFGYCEMLFAIRCFNLNTVPLELHQPVTRHFARLHHQMRVKCCITLSANPAC